jgi:hypothetical protein
VPTLQPLGATLAAIGEERDVRTPDWALDCVVFLCTDAADDEGNVYPRPYASGFFVFVPYENDPSQLKLYVVTARHVIEEPAAETIYVRVSTKYRGERGHHSIPTKRSDWSSSDKADVAALPIVFPRSSGPITMPGPTVGLHFVDSDHRFRGYPLPQEFVQRSGGLTVGVGDGIFFTGLFVQLPGRDQQLPIARSGTIARLPEEPIIIGARRSGEEYTFEIDAYLTETHSCGGHSGSPAFWHFEWTTMRKLPTPDGSGLMVQVPRVGAALLGLVSAHFDIPTNAKGSGEFANLGGELRVQLNSGIAAVTPASRIEELLMRDDFKKDRATHVPSRREGVATADSALPATGTQDEIAFSREDFEEAVRRVSRRTSQSDEASSET